MSNNVDNSQNDNEQVNSRRQFLGWGAAIAGLAIAPGVTLFDLAHGRPADEPASSKIRWGMLIDSTKCASGCDDCVAACGKENGFSGKSETDSQWIRKIELKDLRTGNSHSLPMMCQHCENPPCVDVCPTGASFKRADGIVLVDRHICIGCRYCMMACPYKARSFVHQEIENQNPDVPRGKGCVEACTLCVQRIDNDLQPACVEACSSKAMLFGDLNDPNSEISKRIATSATTQVRADLNLNVGIRYQGI
ncbi:MAG: sulfate reduction electron transfer complex DsrMKJOP subunit DsrO [Sulfurimicrobium sp.]